MRCQMRRFCGWLAARAAHLEHFQVLLVAQAAHGQEDGGVGVARAQPLAHRIAAQAAKREREHALRQTCVAPSSPHHAPRRPGCAAGGAVPAEARVEGVRADALLPHVKLLGGRRGLRAGREQAGSSPLGVIKQVRCRRRPRPGRRRPLRAVHCGSSLLLASRAAHWAPAHLRRQLPRHDPAGDQREVRGGVEEADDGPHGRDEQRHGVAAHRVGERGEGGGQGNGGMPAPSRLNPCTTPRPVSRRPRPGTARNSPAVPWLFSRAWHSPLAPRVALSAAPGLGWGAGDAPPTAACTRGRACGTSRPGGP